MLMSRQFHLKQAKHLRKLAPKLPMKDRHRAHKLAGLNEAMARIQGQNPPPNSKDLSEDQVVDSPNQATSTTADQNPAPSAPAPATNSSFPVQSVSAAPTSPNGEQPSA